MTETNSKWPSATQDRIDPTASEHDGSGPRCLGPAGPSDPREGQEWGRLFRVVPLVTRRSLVSWRLQDQDLDDCIQDVWIDLLRRLRDADRGALPLRLGPWVATLARNKAADLIRRRYRRPAVTLSDEATATLCDRRPAEAEAATERELRRRLVRVAVVQLYRLVPATNFRLFYRHWYRLRPLGEIAGTLGLTPAQARYRHHRTTRVFRRLLARALDDSRLP